MAGKRRIILFLWLFIAIAGQALANFGTAGVPNFPDFNSFWMPPSQDTVELSPELQALLARDPIPDHSPITLDHLLEQAFWSYKQTGDITKDGSAFTYHQDVSTHGPPTSSAVLECSRSEESTYFALTLTPYTSTSSAKPNTIAPTKKLMTVNPITRRRLIPAIANTGNAQNGWTMLVTCSPMATAIVVAA